MAKIPVQQEVPALVKSFTKNGVTYNAVRQGKIVTITGNEIEDADALCIADIGCTVGKQGTDVAKGNADIIITNNNFILFSPFHYFIIILHN